ncbi:hypothetical protein SAMN05444003_1010 [Cognatiyoonia sediminum]|uniref:DoxX-like family protein n=1 Tax=Cognatiyoonia sediminum TaxID=1508389 RepID=A0A1M5MTU7_9RHOB|nr:DUF4267 domain-containing protein [Cognatiyoonia sediminum]SHG80552.1 hypothetical protein SAMN05444003_1010 [Cognatiyoonia sediminum]
MKIVRIIGYVIGFGLLAFGAWFLIAPEAALAETSHRLDTLPYVMGGRYAFFGAMLIGALYHGDPTVTAYLLAGFAGLGFFDAILYASFDPWPHLIVGVLSLAASLFFFQHRKSAA